MNVVDSSGWLEYFADTPAADTFGPVIEDVSHVLVPSIVLLEVFKRLVQRSRKERAVLAAAQMTRGRVVDLDRRIALHAALLGLKHKLPLADSVILATARQHNATLWTQDAHFKGLDGVTYLPATNGKRGA